MREPSAVAPATVPGVDAATQESRRHTRARTRAQTQPETPQPDVAPARPAHQQPGPNHAPPTKANKAFPAEPTPAAVAPDGRVWDPASKDI